MRASLSIHAVVLFLAVFVQPAKCPGQNSSAFNFSQHVKPILAHKCFACHGPDEAESGLRLHEQQSALQQTNSGRVAIVPGKPDESELIRRILSDDHAERMPPEGPPLSNQEIEILRSWIQEGAEYQPHWAFVAPESVSVPLIERTDWANNPIDAFVLAQLEESGLSPSPPASKHVLCRRVYYDVTGLPPTPEQVLDFVNDDRPDALARLVDRLLASPRYGERWARHWLDVVRYAETNSFERDSAKPMVWKYRDYVIRSLNEDKPYDQFVREQIAGDEMDEVTIDSITATGYYRLGTWDDEPADRVQSKYDDLDNILSTTGQAFLGLTVGCARCHDHKIDPITQADYYSLLSFIADITPYGVGQEKIRNSLWDVSDPAAKDERETLAGEQDRLRSEKSKIEQAAIKKMPAEDQHLAETDQREEMLQENIHLYLTAAEFEQYGNIKTQIAKLQPQIDALPPPELLLSVAICEPHPGPTHIMLRGNPHVLGEAVAPRFPEVFGSSTPELPASDSGARSAGRRRVLADWIASTGHPLTSRVIVNRIWQHHFGRGIVRSANNFGQLGTPPTHPELLDWLSVWLIENDWSLKALHRLILNSNTYQMSSTANPEGLAADPENNLFWRFNMRRLSAEEIRDSVLQVSGRLNEEMYGPSLCPPLSDEVLQTQSIPGKGWGVSPPREAARRSIYIHIKRSLIPPELASFDYPETDTSCEARFNTVQPAQVLTLLHGQFIQKQARYLTERVALEVGDDLNDQVPHALELALTSKPDDETVLEGLDLIEQLTSKYGLSERVAMQQFCLLVFNMNEFMYLD